MNVLESDVCVIGCGPAGITVARELVGAGASVVLVESGGLEPDTAARALLAGRASGPVLKDYPTYLADSRGAGVGGAGGGWGRGGRPWWMSFAPIDFERRDWVDGSGWPFGAAELAPYAARAAAALGIRPFEPPSPLLPAGGGSLVSHSYHYPPNPAVLRDQFSTLAGDRRFRAELGTTATGFEVRDGRVERVRLHRADGSQRGAAARVFVLAAGGVENARVLLLDGVAAGRAALGRCFMEHFHVLAGTVRLRDAEEWGGYLGSGLDPSLGHDRLRVLGLADDVQRRERLLGATVQLRVDGEGLDAGGQVECELFVRAEQGPNPQSRVALGGPRDRLGRQRAVLRWTPVEQDWDSIVRSASLVASELRDAFGAEPRLTIARDAPWPSPPAGPASSRTPAWGNHHMGTTRMHEDPEHGVVDASCRVHGTTNLFVAGSSVFPTSSFANPTFTIVVLAIRLADHVRARLS